MRGHLSSPGRASSLPVTPDEASSTRPIAPFTTQHPHPVPLAETTSRSLIEDFDTTSFYDPGDFIPLTQSGHTAELDDGLELLVSQEDLPIGTPGGTKADLKRGALVDGAKHEKHGQSRV